MQITQTMTRAARMFGSRPAIRWGDRVLTWSEVRDRAGRIAAVLHAHGIGDGDRVAALSMNNGVYAELLYAVPWAGGVIVPLNIRWAAPEIAYALQESGATLLLVDATFAPLVPELRRLCPQLRQVLWIDDGAAPEGMDALETHLRRVAPVPDANRSGDALYAIFYTGGTTGHPKGVMLSHKNALALGWGWLAAHPLGEEPMVHLHVAGMFHLAAAAYIWYTTAAAGTNVLLPKFEPEAVMRAIAQYKVNSVVLIPTMVNMVLAHPSFGDYDLTSLRSCIYGGSPIPESLLRTALDRLPTWRFTHIYGMTETAGAATMLPPSHHVFDGPLAAKLTSAGRAMVVCEVRIVGPDGQELPPGEVGEISIRGDNIMLGYWNDPALTARALRDGWLYTGDAARMDADGFIYVVDRIKDMIVSGGENVYSAEVENAVHKHPAVLECAVIAIPDAKWGEAVHAVVATRPGCSVGADELLAHCRTLIAGYKCPRSFTIGAEPLPKTAAGKLAKNVLREPWWAGHARRVN